jgi:hypothetical protein
MPTINVQICDNFSAPGGTGSNWVGYPPGASIQAVPSSQWPFNVGPPIMLPPPMTVFVKQGLKPGKHLFLPSCCPKPVECIVPND